MDQKYDKLGRRIPVFDRSAAGKKAAATNKENDEDYYNKLGTSGGKHRTRGYFGKLKDEGRIEELRKVSNHRGRGYFGKLKDEGKIKELKAISKKGALSNNKTIRSRGNSPVSGGQS